MSRLITILLFSTACLLLVATGCNKEGKKKIDTNKIEDTAPSLTSRPEAETRDISEEEAARQRNEEMRTDLREELIAMLPEFSFTYDADADKFSGEGLAEGGISVPPLIDKLETRVKTLQTKPGPAQYQQLIRVMLTQFKSSGMSAQNSNSEPASDEPYVVPEVDPTENEYGLKKAPKAYGEWRSIREEGENYTIDHDENYYKQLLVYYNKNAMFSTFAKGQRIKHDEFDYSFDSNNAELLLTAQDGRYNMRMYCFTRDSEPGLMYVKQQNGNSYTVYEKLGRGEEPMSEQEMQDFLDLQKEISGGGGSAKKGAE